MRILVTGGAGFIGSATCRYLIERSDHEVLNVDKLTYAANLSSLGTVSSNDRYSFHKLDICDGEAIFDLMTASRVDAIIHLAAESHVDRSIDAPDDFINTNIVGTYELLKAARRYWSGLPERRQAEFRFLHVSTDEVFGQLPLDGGAFSETTAYAPSSPYSASKAASDHLVMAWWHTYGLPVLMTNCSNNYGPFHFPEKLIPLMILNALDSKTLPVYGNGQNVRDWLYVDDHADALVHVLQNGKPGESYNIGGNAERTNLEVVEAICDLVDIRCPRSNGPPRRELITFVNDRPGHDLRYAMDITKINSELNWSPSKNFEEGLSNTVDWYLQNERWWKPIREGRYEGQRLGIVKRA